MVIEDRPSHFAAVRRILWGVLVANLILTIIKIFLGMVTGALAVVADGFHSLVDTSSNLIGLTAIKLANRPADKRHPYGYQRYETIGAMAIGGLLIVAAWEIIKSLFDRILNGFDTEITWVTFTIFALTLPINLGIVIYETRAGKRLNSSILLADATHTRTDLYVSASVISSLVGVWLGWSWLDLVIAGIVVVLIIKASIGILKDTVSSLADFVGIDPKYVEDIALQVPGVKYVHNIRSRGSSDAVFVDLHVIVAPSMSTEMAHGVASAVEERLRSETDQIVDAVVHIEPARDNEVDDWENLYYGLRQIADGLGLGIHDLNFHVDSKGFHSIEMDLEINGDVTLENAHRLADEFENKVFLFWPQATQVITHLEPKSNEFMKPYEGSDPDLKNMVSQFLISELGEKRVNKVQAFNMGRLKRVVVKLMMNPDINLGDSHQLIEELKRKVILRFPEISRLVIHVEPKQKEKGV